MKIEIQYPADRFDSYKARIPGGEWCRASFLDDALGLLVRTHSKELGLELDSDGPLPPIYDPTFGDDRECKCGHPYYRHFDTYENMAPVGCKYCECYRFKETPDTESGAV